MPSYNHLEGDLWPTPGVALGSAATDTGTGRGQTMRAHPDEPLPTSCPTPGAQQSRNAPKTGQRSRFLHILGGDCCSRANRLRVSNPKISERPQRSPAQPATAPNENTPGGTRQGHYQNLERETGFAGQPCWPSACDGVAANRRPSAWQETPNPRKISSLRSS